VPLVRGWGQIKPSNGARPGWRNHWARLSIEPGIELRVARLLGRRQDIEGALRPPAAGRWSYSTSSTDPALRKVVRDVAVYLQSAR